MNATVSTSIPIESHTIREEVGREFIRIKIDGWDDVKKICKKVLLFDGREFIFSGWNSDHNYCMFYRMLDGSTLTAKIK